MEAVNEKISFKNIVLRTIEWGKFLLSKSKKIIVISVLGSMFGLLLSFFSPPQYSAFLSFTLDEDKGTGSLAGYLGVASQLGIDIGSSSGGSLFTGENIIELVKSRLVIEKTLLKTVEIEGDKRTFADYYIERFDWREALEKKGLGGLNFSEKNRSKFTRTQDSLLYLIYNGILKNNMSVFKVDKKLSIYNLIITSKDEVFSKYFTEAIMDEVSELYIETRTKKSKAMVALLEQKADSVKQAYEHSMQSGAEFSDANRNLSRQVVSSISLKKQMEVQMLATYYAEITKHLEASKITLSKETPLIQKIDRPIFPLEKKKLGKLKGIVLGGFICGFLSSFYFIAQFSLLKIIRED